MRVLAAAAMILILASGLAACVARSSTNLTLNIEGCRTLPGDLICPGEPIAVAACPDGNYYLFKDDRPQKLQDEAPPRFTVLGRNDPPRSCASRR